MRKTVHAAAVAFMALQMGGTPAAHAADLDQPPLFQPESSPMVEFGSGWYLRGDVGYSTMGVPVGVAPTNVGSGLAPPAAQTIFGGTTSHYGSLGATIGAGYQFNNWLRSDATFDWRQDHTVSINTYGLNCALDETIGGVATLTNNGGCYKNDTVTTQSWTGLLNVYGDLGHWFGLTPYVGGGAGVTHIRATAQESWYWDYGAPYGGAGFNSYQSNAANVLIHYGYPGNIGPIQTRNNFSWALMAGVSYDLAPSVKLDIGYRYLNMGYLSATNAAGQTVHRTVDLQEVRAGLRFTPDL